MLITQTCIEFGSNVGTRRINTASAIRSQAVIDWRTICLAVGRREIMRVTVARIGLGSSVGTCRVSSTSAVGSQAVVDWRTICLAV